MKRVLAVLFTTFTLVSCAHDCPQAPEMSCPPSQLAPPTEESCKELTDRHSTIVIEQLAQCNASLKAVQEDLQTKAAAKPKVKKHHK